MTKQTLADILRKISDALEIEEIVERLELDSEELCDILADKIADNLEAFEDIYEEY